MKIIKLKLSELKPAEKNVRMHPPEQIREYKRSVEKFGQTKAIVIDENNEILIGNGLYMALSELGYEYAYCDRRTDLSPNDKKKLMMSDNRIFNLGTDDIAMFDQFISELDGDFDIPGYSEDFLNSLIMTDEEVSGMLSEYGSIDEEEAETIRRANVPYEEPDLTAQQPASATASVPTSANVPDNNVGNNEGREVTPDRKYVICPTCGDKIWL